MQGWGLELPPSGIPVRFLSLGRDLSFPFFPFLSVFRAFLPENFVDFAHQPRYLSPVEGTSQLELNLSA